IKTAELGTFAAYRTNDLQSEIRHAEAFGRFIRNGEAALNNEQRHNMLEKRAVGEGGNQSAHIGSYSSLGYFVPTGFTDAVEAATKYFAPLLEDGVFNVIRTASGQALPFPVSDDTANACVIVGESSGVSDLDVSANHVILGAYKTTSGVIK